MMRFKSKLLSLNAHKAVPVQVFSPANCEELRIPFRRDKIARVVGHLANKYPPPTALPSPPASPDEIDAEKTPKTANAMQGQIVSGVLVQNDFNLSLMAPEDLDDFTGLETTTITCRQRLTLAAAGAQLIRWALEGTFGSIEVVGGERTNGVTPDDENLADADEEVVRHKDTAFRVMGAVNVIIKEQGETVIEWEGNAHNDGLADAVMAVLLMVETSPAAAKESSKNSHDHEHTKLARNPHANLTPEERLSRLCMFLEAHFGADAVTPIEQPVVKGVPEDDAAAREKAAAAELARLHDLGLPVPGIEVRIEKLVAKVWLETLEVECGTRSFKDRVAAVVERAAETIRPLWGQR